MTYNNEIEVFIKDFVKDLDEGTASIFAGAGLSIPAGYVNWQELMIEIAEDLGLNIKTESDLVSLAQYHVNENRNRTKINRKILEEFTEETEETENHKIIARLPLSSIWTTNYDELIENSLKKENKVVDVKYNNKQLLVTKPKRDIVIYKMHGDVNHPADAILTKEQYEGYHQTHEPFINTLTGELTTKTFLFLGFSFNDPNLDYVLSRLNYRFKEDQRQHYQFVLKHHLNDANNPDEATLDYNVKKQYLMTNDLRRYGIKSLLIDSYEEITKILKEIEVRYKKRTVFISGSAEIYEPLDKNDALGFIHILSRTLIENNYRVVNGFGWGVGSAVINGALEAVYGNPLKFNESQLVLRPFPQFASSSKNLGELWEEYRQKMISLSGISIFLFGNKQGENEIIEANGVIREFEIAHELGNLCIPIAFTESASRTIYNSILKNPKDYYEQPTLVMPHLENLASNEGDVKDKVKEVIKIVNKLRR